MNNRNIDNFEPTRINFSMKYLFILIIGLTLISSCEKSPKCWGKVEKNEGEIIADTTLCSNCTILTNENEGYVINTDRDLWNIYYKNFGNNGVRELRDFDFTKYSLLGMTTTATCKYKIKREVTVNAEELTYYYDIYIKECGNCEEKHYLTNWVMIPKIKSGYKVIFRSHIND